MKPNQKEKKMLTVDQAMKLREDGEFEKALDALQEIRADYEARGENTSDIWGHIATCYRLLAKNATESARPELLQQAEDAAHQAFAWAKTPGEMAIARAHLAARLVASQLFGEAIEEGRRALNDLPGSEAHRAWVHNMIARGYAGLGNDSDALHEISVGEKALKEGHDEEMQNPDGERKLAVWWAGLMITKAQVHRNQGNESLAKSELQEVLDKADPEGFMAQRKKEAQELLDALET